MNRLASSTWGREEIEIGMKILSGNTLTMGENVKKFEDDFADYIGTKYAVMFNSGSSANLGIISALRYMRGSKMEPGDNIVVPAVSWSTTYYPISQNGFHLNFVDIDLKTLNIDVNKIEAAINTRTKAIFAVNLLGNPADLNKLSELASKHNLILIEDNCESLGATIEKKKAGSFGMASSHSFFYSHHICTMEGGMVNTNSKEFMETLISIRAHGWTRGLGENNSVHPHSSNAWEDLFRFVLPGYNLRPLELSGAIGIEQLRKFPEFLSHRQKNGEFFQSLFCGNENYLIQTETGNSSWFGFSVILQNKLIGKRSELIKLLSDNGFETRPIVAGNFALNPVMNHLSYLPLPDLPSANVVHTEGFFIGNHHFKISDELEVFYKLLQNFERKF
jgi:CDP-6-deoxy-D-xylo-4-hexulose-3-dehydrase